MLVGGAVISIYTDNKYESDDLDFATGATGRELKEAMTEIGFTTKFAGAKDMHHKDTGFYVEFVNPPIRVGNEYVRELECIETPLGTLRLLTPTDIVKDRLTAWKHWNDRPSLDQAVLVARDQKVDFDDLEKWATKEGAQDVLAEMKAFLKK